MIWYVQIPKINGRTEFDELVKKLNIRGFEDRVEYHSGGWVDNELGTLYPHLRFQHEDDALAYVLAYGGEVSKMVPVRGG
jgi:hypothetical protein